MRGEDARAGSLFSYVDLEDRVPASHPLRAIRGIVNATLANLSPLFAKLYAPLGRPSIPPEQLLRALLLQAFYSIRSERQLMERLDFDLLFRWFVGLGIDDPVWDHSTYSKNRDRLLAGDVAAWFLATLLDRPDVRQLLSSEHFSVDGTMIQAWASMKSFRPKDGSGEPPTGGRNGTRSFRGERRSNATHAFDQRPRSLALPQGTGHGGQALLPRPCADGEPKWPCRRRRAHPRIGSCRAVGGLGHARPPANREPDNARRRQRLRRRELRSRASRRRVTPHIAQNTSRRSAIDGRTTRHAGYVQSQRARKRIEEAFGWIKTTAGQARTRLRGIERVRWSFTLAAAAYNLMRLPKLAGAA